MLDLVKKGSKSGALSHVDARTTACGDE